MKYPFVPKSTSYLEEGQIIAVPLSNKTYACGRVLQLKYENGKKGSRQFIVGLMNWNGKKQPSSESISKSTILTHGQVHVKTIKECAAEIVGCRELWEDNLEVPLSLDQAPGKNCKLIRGYDVLRIATVEEQEKLSVFSTWGYNVLKIQAEKYFVNQNL